MKSLVYIILVCLPFGLFAQDPEDDRLEIFMDKLEAFSKNAQGDSFWTMLYRSQSVDQYNMPVISNYSIDGRTGLHYSEHKGIIREPDLEIEFDVQSGKLFDLKRNEEYGIYELIEQRKKRKII
jgi:hypothetical protein